MDSSFGLPYYLNDIFDHSVSSSALGVEHVCALAQVCKAYDELSNDPEIWMALSEIEGVPLVEQTLDCMPNLKRDFLTLYRITISRKIVAEIYGKVTGKMPMMRRDWFEQLFKPDPFDPKKLCKDNYVIVVDPVFIERYRKTFNEIQNCHEVHIEQIPLSLKNLLSLSGNRLDKKEIRKVFCDKSYTPAFVNHSEIPAKVGLYIMRKSLVEETKGLSFEKLKEHLECRGPGPCFKMAPLRQRAFFNSITILKSGTCYDEVGSYTITSDTVIESRQPCHVYIGGYSKKEGAMVHVTPYSQACIGGVPYASVAVADDIDDIIIPALEKLSIASEAIET